MVASNSRHSQHLTSLYSNLKYALACVLAFSLNLFVITPSFASAGDLDPTFGEGGKVITDFPIKNALYGSYYGHGAAIAVQDDNKVLIVGNAQADFLVTRLKPDGTLDETFGESGQVITNIGSTLDNALAVTVQTDGKIVVGGVTDTVPGNKDFAIVRYNQDGSIDSTFGDYGRVITDFGSEEGSYSNDYLLSIFVQKDGRIIAIGEKKDVSNYLAGGISVVAYRPDGKIDVSFGEQGKFLFSHYDTDLNSLKLGDVVIQDNDKLIFLVGASGAQTSDSFLWFRINVNGSLDTSFGQSGTLVYSAYPNSSPKSMLLQPNGKINTLADINHVDFSSSILRFNPDGTWDGTFGINGIAPIEAEDYRFVETDFEIKADGSMIVAGTHQKQEWNSEGWSWIEYNDFAAIGLKSNGSLNIEFGSNGMVIVPFDTNERDARADGVALLDDQRIVITGGLTYYPNGISKDHRSGIAVAMLTPGGNPDLGFGFDGKAIITALNTPDNTAQDQVIAQSDGKILVAGYGADYGYATGKTSGYDFQVARYLPNGSLDSSFGDGGRVVTDFRSFRDPLIWQNSETYDDVASSMVMQPDGKVIVAGGSSGWVKNNYGYPRLTSSFALSRYKNDGSLDEMFGNNGKILTDFVPEVDFIPNAHAVDVVVQPDGKIIAVGHANDRPGGGAYETGIAMARYDLDGSLDVTFGNGGQLTINKLQGYKEYANSVALQQDGKIVVGGFYSHRTPWIDDGGFELIRLNTDGSFDTNFGSGGIVTADIDNSFYASDQGGSDDEIRDIAIQSDGKIVVGGSSYLGGTAWDMVLMRYNGDGSLDLTFGNDGVVISDFGDSLDSVLPNGTDQINSLDLQEDGRIVAAGYTGRWVENPERRLRRHYPYYQSYDFALMRLEHDGTFDYSFGNGGKVTTSFNSYYNGANSVSLQADGKILAVGLTESLPTEQFNGEIIPGDLNIAISRHEGVSNSLDEIEALVFHVQDIVKSKFINEGLAKSLQSKLQAALQQMDRYNAKAATNQLDSFINEINVLLINGKFPELEGLFLISQTQKVIIILGG